jgi:hypothetical protein
MAKPTASVSINPEGVGASCSPRPSFSAASRSSSMGCAVFFAYRRAAKMAAPKRNSMMLPNKVAA